MTVPSQRLRAELDICGADQQSPGRGGRGGGVFMISHGWGRFDYQGMDAESFDERGETHFDTKLQTPNAKH